MKKILLKKYLLTFAIFLGTTIAFSMDPGVEEPGCPVGTGGDVILCSEHDLIDFNNDKITEVTGNLIFGADFPNIDVTLPYLEKVTGYLSIQSGTQVWWDSDITPGIKSLVCPNLVSAYKLVVRSEHIETIDMPKLETLSSPDIPAVGTSNMIFNTAALDIGNHYQGEVGAKKLTNLNLPKLQIVNWVQIKGTNLTNLSLPSLEENEYIFIHRTGSLTNLSLPSLVKTKRLSVRGNLSLINLLVPELKESSTIRIDHNVSLTNLSLLNLKEIDGPDLLYNWDRSGQLCISRNPSLQYLSLPKLEKIDNLEITQNESLYSISTPLLEEIGNFLRLRDNEKLSHACLLASATRVLSNSTDGSTDIANNGANASSVDDILNYYCKWNLKEIKLSGVVYVDDNNSCNPDEQIPIGGIKVTLTPANGTPMTTVTNSVGEYRFRLNYEDEGNYTISVDLSSTPQWIQNPSCNQNYNELFNVGDYPNLDFGLKAQTNVCGVSLEINRLSPVACPGRDLTHGIYITNDGTSVISAGQEIEISQLYLPSNTVGNSVTLITESDINPGGTIQVNHTNAIDLYNTATGYFTKAELDLNTASCSEKVSVTIVDQQDCAYDPNAVSVSPAGCGNSGNILKDQELTYKVQFENIGFGTAFHVYLEDKLDENLDLNTLQLLGSSHEVTALKVDYDNVLHIDFRYIDLLGAQFPGKNRGYVEFKISPKSGLAEGTSINNKVSIVFNENEAIETNTVQSTFRDVLYGDASFTHAVDCDLVLDVEASDVTSGLTYEWFFKGDPSTLSAKGSSVSGVTYGNTEEQKVVALEVSKDGCIARKEATIDLVASEELDCGLDLSGVVVTTTDETCAGNDGTVTLDIPGYEAGSVDVSNPGAGSIVVPGTQVYWSAVNMTSGVLHVKGTAVFYGDLTIGPDVVGLIEGTVSVYGDLTIAGKVHNLGTIQATGQTTIIGSLYNEANANLTNLVSGSVTSGSPAANYSVVWEDGFEGVTRSDLSEGTYVVTVTNLEGESGEIEVVVGKECIVPPGPTVVTPYPNPVSGVGDLTIQVKLPADEPNFELRLNSYWGTLLNEVHNGPLSAGEHTFTINIPNEGFYLKYLQYSSNGGSGAIMITRMPY